MALKGGIHASGIRELQKGLKEFAPEIAKELRGEFLAVAKTVAEDAKSQVPVSGRTVERYVRTTKSGRADRRYKGGTTTSGGGGARGSIRAGTGVSGPFVAGGKKTVPYYGWLDFGSRNPIRGRPRSVGPWKGSGAGPSKGRFIYPAIDRNRDELQRRVTDAVEKAKRAFRSSLP
jgi:hypothetical protein